MDHRVTAFMVTAEPGVSVRAMTSKMIGKKIGYDSLRTLVSLAV